MTMMMMKMMMITVTLVILCLGMDLLSLAHSVMISMEIPYAHPSELLHLGFIRQKPMQGTPNRKSL